MCLVYLSIRLVHVLKQRPLLLPSTTGRTSLLTCDGAMDLGAVLELNGDRFMAEFHQKPAVVESHPRGGKQMKFDL